MKNIKQHTAVLNMSNGTCEKTFNMVSRPSVLGGPPGGINCSGNVVTKKLNTSSFSHCAKGPNTVLVGTNGEPGFSEDAARALTNPSHSWTLSTEIDRRHMSKA